MTVLLEPSFVNGVFLIFRQESAGRPEILVREVRAESRRPRGLRKAWDTRK